MEETLAEQDSRQSTVEGTDPWYAKIRSALTDPDSYTNQCFFVVDEYLSGIITHKQCVRLGPVHQVLGILLNIDIERQSVNDTNRLKAILRVLGFKKIRPNKKWFEGTHAYQLSEDTAPHLWHAMMAAVQASKAGSFSKESESQ